MYVRVHVNVTCSKGKKKDVLNLLHLVPSLTVIISSSEFNRKEWLQQLRASPLPLLPEGGEGASGSIGAGGGHAGQRLAHPDAGQRGQTAQNSCGGGCQLPPQRPWVLGPWLCPPRVSLAAPASSFNLPLHL